MTGKEAGLLFAAFVLMLGGTGTASCQAGLGIGEQMGRNALCKELVGKSARYIEGRCYVASPDGSLVPAKGAK